MRYRAALLTCVLVSMSGLFGCGGGSGSGPTGPTEGTLEGITSTTGSEATYLTSDLFISHPYAGMHATTS